MRWLGLNWDEGPYHQSQRLDLYRATAEKFIASGHAYYCFCSKDQLEQRRAAAQAAGRPPMYERTCRRVASEEAARRRTAGERCAIRFAVPESGSTAWDDANFRDYIPFYEYFHGDSGRGIGASHQTGWTAVIANLLQTFLPSQI